MFALARDLLMRAGMRPIDIADGLVGAVHMLFAWLTPFRRAARCRRGLSAEAAARVYVGDELVPEARWQWTHAIDIDAAPADVWPWVAQIGVGRGGFYSYQWLENLVGCQITNAESIHPEFQLHLGDGVALHPKMPPIPVVALVPGSHLVLCIRDGARTSGGRYSHMSWAFVLETLGERRCRLVSRYRADHSNDLPTRLAAGPTLLEPIGYAMDRRMLRGIKARAERSAHAARALETT